MESGQPRIYKIIYITRSKLWQEVIRATRAHPGTRLGDGGQCKLAKQRHFLGPEGAGQAMAHFNSGPAVVIGTGGNGFHARGGGRALSETSGRGCGKADLR